MNEYQGIAYLPPVRQETMMGVASSAMGREAGRGLLTLAALHAIEDPHTTTPTNKPCVTCRYSDTVRMISWWLM